MMLCFRYFDILFCFRELPVDLSRGDMLLCPAFGPYSACGFICTTDLRLPFTVLLAAAEGLSELLRERMVASYELVILEGP